MNTINYLNNLLSELTIEDVILKMKDDYGVTMKSYEKNGVTLYSVNYSQIDSPRFNEIVDECRSLILELKNNQFHVVSRAFDRFYNYEELTNPDIPQFGKDVIKNFLNAPNYIKIFEKLDGSLIKLYHHEDLGWVFSTRSVPFAEQCDVESLEGKTTFQDLINRFNFDVNKIPNGYEHLSFIFELCCTENKVVTTYEKERFVLLSIRDNETGTYLSTNEVERISEILNVELPQTLAWTNFDDLMKTVKELPDLKEGFILFNELTQDRIKIKSPIYVHAHHLRTNGVMTIKKAYKSYDEKDEILAYFPELEKFYDAINTGTEMFEHIILSEYDNIKHIQDQKEFVKAVKNIEDKTIGSSMFYLRRGSSVKEIWDFMFECHKINFIESLQLV